MTLERIRKTLPFNWARFALDSVQPSSRSGGELALARTVQPTIDVGAVASPPYVYRGHTSVDLVGGANVVETVMLGFDERFRTLVENFSVSALTRYGYRVLDATNRASVPVSVYSENPSEGINGANAFTLPALTQASETDSNIYEVPTFSASVVLARPVAIQNPLTAALIMRVINAQAVTSISLLIDWEVEYNLKSPSSAPASYLLGGA